MAEPRRIVLLGAMAQMPFAGVAWQVLHYLEGLRRLGHEVTYVEDTATWPYDPERDTVTDDARPAARRLERILDRTGFGGRWAFRNGARAEELFGMSEAALERALTGADALVNLSGATVLREPHLRVPVRIYLETDPVTPQLEIDMGREFTRELLAAHTHHFSFGERLGRTDCPVPVDGFNYLPTRQPVVLDWWPLPARFPARPRGALRFTTVGNWEQTAKDVEWRGEVYRWSKSAEFMKLLGLPERVDATLELGLALDDRATIAMLEERGWRVVNALQLSRDPDVYRDYIASSGAEFSAAKDQNVRLRSGWFSDRTATYLASGRPAVVQDTGFDAALPVGTGLLAFRDEDEAAEAVATVGADYERHSRAAREIAEDCFRAEDVIASVLERAGL